MSAPGGEAFSQLLRRRRMVRSYLPDPINRETIERIVGRSGSSRPKRTTARSSPG